MKDESKARKNSSESDYEDDENEEYEEYNEDDNEQDSRNEERHEGTRLLTYIQIFGSIAILAAALAIRVFSADFYNTVRTWYLSAVNDSIIADEQMDQAKRTVIGLWNSISSAGPQSQASSQAESSQTQSSQVIQSSQAAVSSQATVSSAAQSKTPVSSTSGKAPNGTQQVSP